MRIVRIVGLCFLLILSTNAYCTVDFLAANHITKELYVFEESYFMGIGWEVVAGEEPMWIRQEKMLLAKGYQYTTNPNKLDEIVGIVGCFIGIVIGIWLLMKRRKYKILKER